MGQISFGDFPITRGALKDLSGILKKKKVRTVVSMALTNYASRFGKLCHTIPRCTLPKKAAKKRWSVK